MPKAMEDRVPLASYWAAIKGKYVDLAKNPAFKPDINGPIKTYDLGINNYIKLMQDRDKLKDFLISSSKNLNDINSKIGQHQEELAKIWGQDKAKEDGIRSSMSSAMASQDTAKISTGLIDWSTTIADMSNTRNQLWAQMAKLADTRVQGAKKLSDEYKAKVAGIGSGMKKIEEDSIKLEAQIRSIISAYQNVATKMNKDDLVDAVRGLLDHF
jgi:hypothetical protein